MIAACTDAGLTNGYSYANRAASRSGETTPSWSHSVALRKGIRVTAGGCMTSFLGNTVAQQIERMHRAFVAQQIERTVLLLEDANANPILNSFCNACNCVLHGVHTRFRISPAFGFLN